MLRINLGLNTSTGGHIEINWRFRFPACSSNLSAICQINYLRSAFWVAWANDNSIPTTRIYLCPRCHRISAISFPTTEFIILISRFRFILRQDNNRFVTDDIIIVNRIAIGILYDNMFWFEHSFISHIAAFILYPDHNGVCTVNGVFKAIAVYSRIEDFPIGFCWRCCLTVGNPVRCHTRTAAILHEGNPVLVNAHTSIGEGNVDNIFPCIFSADYRFFFIQKGYDISLRYFWLIAFLIPDNQFKSVFAGFPASVILIILNLCRIGNPSCLVYHIIVRVVDFIVPLSNFSIRTGQCTWFGFVHDVYTNLFAGIQQMLLVNGHKLLACSRIFHIEVGQRQITGNRCLLEFYLFNIICVDILGHQFHIVITAGNIPIFRAQTLMRDIAFFIFGRVCDNLPILPVGDVENFIFIHTVNPIGIGLVFLIRNLRIIAVAHQVDEIFVIRALIVLYILQCIKGTGFIAHFQVQITEYRQFLATMTSISDNGTKAIESGVI